MKMEARRTSSRVSKPTYKVIQNKADALVVNKQAHNIFENKVHTTFCKKLKIEQAVKADALICNKPDTKKLQKQSNNESVEINDAIQKQKIRHGKQEHLKPQRMSQRKKRNVGNININDIGNMVGKGSENIDQVNESRMCMPEFENDRKNYTTDCVGFDKSARVDPASSIQRDVFKASLESVDRLNGKIISDASIISVVANKHTEQMFNVNLLDTISHELLQNNKTVSNMGKNTILKETKVITGDLERKVCEITESLDNKSTENNACTIVKTEALENYSSLEKLHQNIDCSQVEEKADIKSDREMLTKFTCPICAKALSNRHNLKKHVFIHEGIKPFTCEICGRSFAVKEYLTLHMLSHTGKKLHTCKQCGKMFSRKSNLNSHMLIHTDQQQYACSICNKLFRRRTSRDIHQHHHVKRPAHVCHICGNAYSSQTYLQIHLNIHQGERPYKCTVCDKSFPYCQSLVEHMRRHTGEKPAVCEQCGKSHNNKRQLRVHLKYHAVKTAYCCFKCTMYFQSEQSLNKHLYKTHNHEHACDFCDKTFVNKKHLRSHRFTEHRDKRMQSNKKPRFELAKQKKVECNQCGRVFYNRYVLSQHLIKKHGMSREAMKEILKIRERKIISTKPVTDDFEKEIEVGKVMNNEVENLRVYYNDDEMEVLVTVPDGFAKHKSKRSDEKELHNGSTYVNKIPEHQTCKYKINAKSKQVLPKMDSSLLLPDTTSSVLPKHQLVLEMTNAGNNSTNLQNCLESSCIGGDKLIRMLPNMVMRNNIDVTSNIDIGGDINADLKLENGAKVDHHISEDVDNDEIDNHISENVADDSAEVDHHISEVVDDDNDEIDNQISEDENNDSDDVDHNDIEVGEEISTEIVCEGDNEIDKTNADTEHIYIIVDEDYPRKMFEIDGKRYEILPSEHSEDMVTDYIITNFKGSTENINFHSFVNKDNIGLTEDAEHENYTNIDTNIDTTEAMGPEGDRTDITRQVTAEINATSEANIESTTKETILVQNKENHNLIDIVPTADSHEDFVKFEDALKCKIIELEKFTEYGPFLDRMIISLQEARHKQSNKSKQADNSKDIAQPCNNLGLY